MFTIENYKQELKATLDYSVKAKEVHLLQFTKWTWDLVIVYRYHWISNNVDDL